MATPTYRPKLSHYVVSIALLVTSVSAYASDGFRPISSSQLPNYREELEERVTKSGLVNVNGLIATVNAEQFPAASVSGAETIKLRRNVTGFKDDFRVRVKWQSGSAPLVVVLPGIFGKADDRFGRHWMGLLYQTGCHVMCLDSLFRGDVNKRTMLGVPGNLKAEAEALAKLVAMALDSRDKNGQPVRSKVTTVRLFGTSYGGILALNLVRTETARTWPVDRCLAISPPPSMRSTADLVDGFREVDLPKHGTDLLKLLGGYTPKSATPTSGDEQLVRAGIAYVFFSGLRSVVKESSKRYMQDLRDSLDPEEIQRGLSEWKNWTFDDFVNLMASPYWKMTPEQLWRKGDVGSLLEGAPSFVQVVVSSDDPLARPGEIHALQQRFPEPQLLVLPHGGHMGFCGTRWLEDLLTQTFKP